jgi:hypothetical protein
MKNFHHRNIANLDKVVQTLVLVGGIAIFAGYNNSKDISKQNYNQNPLHNIEAILQKEDKYFKSQNYTLLARTPYRI